MQVQSPFNSFTRRFGTIFEPYTPVVSMNAMLATGSMPPGGWSLVAGDVPLVNDGIRKYMRFPGGASGPRQIVAGEDTFNTKYGTNGGGSTTVIVIRINNCSVSSTMTTTLIFSIEAVNTSSISLVGGNRFIYPSTFSSIGTPKFQAVEVNKFMCFTLVQQNSDRSYVSYLNENLQPGKAFTTFVRPDTSGFTTFIQA